ncbi:MAG: hypothetical protein N838_14395 [Thiohalocapsa sp. PB-PSB1]|nr:MAG: hypothetical protein N838_14395 [Thiohalocapsa sp. PB-PSB1]
MARGRARWSVLLLLFLVELVLAAPEAARVAYLAVDAEGYWQVWCMESGGQEPTQVTHTAYDKSRVSWYPDGQALLVNGNQGELARVDLETGDETPIQLELDGMNDAVLSPDGRYIAFSLSTSGSIDDNNIWIVDADGSDLRKLTNKRFLQHDPAWSSDSGSIYFLSGRGDQAHDIWRYELGTGSLEQLTAGQLYHFDVAPAPGSHGEPRLAFSANRSGNYEVWVWSPGTEPRQLTDHPALDARPNWSPDGVSLLFESSRGGTLNIWRMPAEGGEPVPVTVHTAGARMPVWYQGGAR